MLIDGQITYVRLTSAAKHLPLADNKKVHIKTLKRWVTKGVGGVRLRAKKIGGIWHTTTEWLNEFQESLTRKSLKQPIVDPKAMERQDTRDLRELKRRYGFNVRSFGQKAVEQAACGNAG